MTMIYTRDLPGDSPPEVVDEAVAHVRAHLSAVADADDDPETNADDVDVRVEDRDGRIWVTGTLDAEPVAPYLRPGFDPDQDVRNNPLSVPSIQDDGGDGA